MPTTPSPSPQSPRRPDEPGEPVAKYPPKVLGAGNAALAITARVRIPGAIECEGGACP